jgi:hypothetical protein
MNWTRSGYEFAHDAAIALISETPPMFETLAIVAVIAVAVFMPAFMVRGVITMYRDKDRTSTISSGIAAAMTEVDRLVRPSTQHVIEVKDSVESHEDDIGGE